MTDGVSGVDSTAPTEAVSPTGINTVDSLVWGRRWVSDTDSATTTISFSFPDANSQFNTGPGGYGPDSDEEPFTGLASLSGTAQDMFRGFLQQIETFTNLSFSEVDDSGDSAGTIRIANTGLPDEDAVGWAYLPGAYQAAGDIWILSANHSEDDVDYGHTLLHELGHALGLKHPFEEEGEFPIIASEFEGVDYTVMSYTVSARFTEAEWQDLWPQTYMYADILALQYLYGVDTVTTAGSDAYAYSQDERHFLTIWDYGGTDTLSVTGSTDVKLDLTPGSWSNVGTTVEYWDGSGYFTDKNTVFITPDTIIERAVGAEGNDTLVGNDVANRLTGNEGADHLAGKGGADVLRGNEGSDSLIGGQGADVLVGGVGDDVGIAGTGNDTVWAGAGDEGDDVMAGGHGNDIIAGGGGDDFLIGGGFDDGDTVNFEATTSTDSVDDDGSDEIYGGEGDDTLLGGGWKDDVSDDGVYTEGEAVTTGTGNDALWGGSGNDLVLAAAGNDSLGGGVGDDTIDGGGGADLIYGGRDAGDTGTNDVIRGGAGNDTVFASAGNDSVNGGAGDDNLFGGGGDDTVDGGAGDDTLWGGGGDDTVDGGAGNDTLWGGGGNDLFTGGGGGDVFIFASGHGDETITDFDLVEDSLRLIATTTDFTDADSVTAASSVVGGNLVIDLGGGDSLTLVGLGLSDIASMTLILE